MGSMTGRLGCFLLVACFVALFLRALDAPPPPLPEIVSCKAVTRPDRTAGRYPVAIEVELLSSDDGPEICDLVVELRPAGGSAAEPVVLAVVAVPERGGRSTEVLETPLFSSSSFPPQTASFRASSGPADPELEWSVHAAVRDHSSPGHH